MTKPKRLPLHPVKCLKIAIKDLRMVAADKRYKPNAGTWHSMKTHDDGYCHVCLAGAVIAGTLDNPINEELLLHHFDDNTSMMLEILDDIRLNRWHSIGFARNLHSKASIKFADMMASVAFKHHHFQDSKTALAFCDELEAMIPQMNAAWDEALKVSAAEKKQVN